MILLLYLSPAKRWLEQSGTAGRQHAELRDLQAENRDLKRRGRDARNRPARSSARRAASAWSRQGERAYVIENLRGD